MISAVCGAIGGVLPGGTLLANGMAGAIEGTVERTLNGEETTWEQLEFDFALSALTGGVLDGVGRKVTSKLAERATKKAAKELAEKTAKEATEKAAKKAAEKVTKEVAEKVGKKVQTGGREIDVNEYMRKMEKADENYDVIRNTSDDISKITKNTSLPEWKIERIKDHVFNNDHILDDRIGRFDADVEMADAWKRLTDGGYNQNDLDLLEHEYFESKFEQLFKTDYRTAHNKTLESGRVWDPYKEVN